MEFAMHTRTLSRLAAAAACLALTGVVSGATFAQSPPYRQVAGANDAYRPSDPYGTGDTYRADDAYRPDDSYRPSDSYGQGDAYRGGDTYRPGGQGPYSGGSGSQGDPYSDYGYGEPYSPPPRGPEPYEDDYASPPPQAAPVGSYYEEGEIVSAGHRFFGSISQGLASAVEYAFSKQGRPNGYILGEDAGGAFILGLRYGEGMLYTKDAGSHKVFWQGPSVGYDAGAEGSKTMVLVYNMRDPGEIYNRFGGVQGSVYVIGGVSVQFQKYGDVTLALIRSGVGLRLGANVGYLKYTRTPTWNPL